MLGKLLKDSDYYDFGNEADVVIWIKGGIIVKALAQEDISIYVIDQDEDQEFYLDVDVCP